MGDIRDFALPDLGEGLEDGEIVEWHVAVGDVVELNQTVADVETAKAVVAIPSPFAGTVVERIGDVGETLAVGAVLLRIERADGTAGEVDARVDPPEHQGEASPAQGGFETGTDAAAAAVPDADAEPTAAVTDDVHGTASDTDDEPQPLVGYGEGRAGSTRRRRHGRDAAGGTPSGPGVDVEGAGAPGASVRPLAKPPVRRLAKELGVDLAAISPGSGPDGRITRDDVQAAVAMSGATSRGVTEHPGRAESSAPRTTPSSAPEAVSLPDPTETTQDAAVALADPSWTGRGEKPVPGFRGRVPGEVEPVRGIRRRIMDKMVRSRREIPEASCSREADLTELWALREVLTEQARADGVEVKITPFALVMRATVLALRRFPTLNARLDEAEDGGDATIRLLEHVNLGFAVDTDRGLFVPNIKDAHARSTLQLALGLADLAGQARDGRIGPDDLTGGTFTVNNYGAFGADDGDPIINHPEAGILGVGAIRERPWVVDGELAVRRVARFTLAFDHRICDGGEAGRFLTYVTDLCEQPGRLLLHA